MVVVFFFFIFIVMLSSEVDDAYQKRVHQNLAKQMLCKKHPSLHCTPPGLGLGLGLHTSPIHGAESSPRVLSQLYPHNTASCLWACMHAGLRSHPGLCVCVCMREGKGESS